MPIIRWYFKVPLVTRILLGFILGAVAGCALSYFGVAGSGSRVISVITIFGTVLVSMLKFVVIPIIFFSLIVAVANFPITQLGKAGLYILSGYFLTSFFAGLLGISLARVMSPTLDTLDGHGSEALLEQVSEMQMSHSKVELSNFINDLFVNPFQALAEGRLLSIILFTVLAGFAIRQLYEKSGKNSETGKAIQIVLTAFDIFQESVLHDH